MQQSLGMHTEFQQRSLVQKLARMMLPVDQTVLSPCCVRPLGNAGDFDGSALSWIKPYRSI
jgi:hypothetical protein